MTYSTLMVHLELGQSNAGLLGVAASLAERFDARVVGIAACQPLQILYSDISSLPVTIIEQDRREIEKKMDDAEAEFRATLKDRVLDWRSTITRDPLCGYIANQARSADLVIACDAHGSSPERLRQLNKSDLVMQLGRPILIVPATAKELTPLRIVVAWKDACEPRRAVADALPLLRYAAQVMVVEIADEEELAAAGSRVKDVVAWLGRHGIVAACQAIASEGHDAVRLNAFAREQDADVLVAGAYGHSRLREWVLGGVTRHLLLRADRCALLSR